LFSWPGCVAGDLLRGCDHLVVVRKGLVLAADPGPADQPLLVDDEDRAVRHARVAGHVLPPYSVGFDELPLEVGDQLEWQAAELLGKGAVAEDTVDADPEDGDARP
jgi:hypothetical protein